ncbi:EpsG family protein [Flavobacterium sp. YJ01]|uniref:EpsG family protein n=1 Tax=unclassified Flavobacterium TaxID=196869 RepID=UPI0023E3ECB4|nr:EpsG family protein [Flavobacterium sp. YJ01]WET01211.1 EpsG family protein [Flavobacterium sp. YJ01]
MIPNELYTPVYYSLLLVFSLLFTLPLLEIVNFNNYPKIIGKYGVVVFLMITILFIGFRDPYDQEIYFGDTIRYTEYYNDFTFLDQFKDIGYYYYMFLCNKIMGLNVVQFYLMTAFLYVFLQYLAVRNVLESNVFFQFVVLLSSMSFWNYGVNGIRTGLASSFFLYAFTAKNKFLKFTFFALSIIMHKSFLLPLLAYFVAYLFGSVKGYIKWWIASVFISLLIGQKILDFINSNLSFMSSDNSDDRISQYMSETSNDGGVFRIDFIIYSAIPIVLGYYYIFKKEFNSKFYEILFKTYLITNSIWVLLIYANFTNRFAYLSWILMPFLLIYPVIKDSNLIKKQNIFIFFLIFCNLLFTILMFIKTFFL